MSGIGIHDFRSLVTDNSFLENRRITVGGDGEQPTEVRAPFSLFGRFIDWVKGLTGGDVGEREATENQNARAAFHSALVKAEGGSEEFASRVLSNALGVSSAQFLQQSGTLDASLVKLVLDEAQTQRDRHVMKTYGEGGAFAHGSALSDAAFWIAKNSGLPRLAADDPDLLKAFERRIATDPDYGRRDYSHDDYLAFAEDAVKSAYTAKQNRFDEQYSALGTLDNGHFHDAGTFFQETKSDLAKAPLNGLRDDQKLWVSDALDGIRDTGTVLAKMSFDPQGAGRLQEEVEQARDRLLLLRQADNAQDRTLVVSTFQSAVRTALGGDRAELADQICDRLTGQLDAFIARFQEAGGIVDANFLQNDVREELHNSVAVFLAEDPPQGLGYSYHDALEVQDAVDQQLIGHTAQFHAELNAVPEFSTTQIGAPRDIGFDDGSSEFDYGDVDVSGSDQEDDGLLETDHGHDDDFVADDVAENMLDDAGGVRPEARDEQPSGLRQALRQEIDRQVEKLDAKLQFLDEYRKSDPLSEKNVAYNSLIWAQASKVALDDVHGFLTGELEQAIGNGQVDRAAKLQDHLDKIQEKRGEAEERVANAHQAWTQSSTERSDVSPKKPGRFENHPFKQARVDETNFLKAALEDAKVLVPGGASDFIKAKRTKALDTMQDWQPIRRDMVVNRDGVTRTYVSQLTPASNIGHGVGASYEGRGGVSSNNRAEQLHPRNMLVSELFRVEHNAETGEDETVRVSQTIRHGVLDSYKIKDRDERRTASEVAAREVVTAAIVSNEKFLARAKENSQPGDLPNGEPRPQSKLVHVNLNLTTADTTLLRQIRPSSREGDFTKHQFAAFEAQNGDQTFGIDGEDVNIHVDTITFSFGVNVVAMGKGIFAHTGTDERWPPAIIEHNRQNLLKLTGDLTVGTSPGGVVGDVVDRLKQEAANPETAPERREALNRLVGQIQRETDVVRGMFNGREYQQGIEDAYKMDRHIMRLCNLTSEGLQTLGEDNTALSVSQGCLSNKDRGGMADVEHKAQLIIEDMGGRVNPGEDFEDQDRVIYNTVLTSSGQAELQQRNTGLPGSKNAKDLGVRIDDREAQRYAAGFGVHNKT